jgi:hypothetical protein
MRLRVPHARADEPAQTALFAPDRIGEPVLPSQFERRQDLVHLPL